MNNIRRFLTIMIAAFAIVQLEAQLLLTEYQAHKVEGDVILLRWEPRSGDEWLRSKENGYTLEKFRISANGEEQWLGKELIRPAEEKEWVRYEKSTTEFLEEFAKGSRSIVHPETEERKNQFDKLFDLKGDKSRSTKLSLGFLLYSISYDFELAKLAGLGYEMKAEGGYSYRFEIRAGTSDVIHISVDPTTYRGSTIPPLLGEWGNKEVTLNWDGSLHQGAFLGYMISKSEDGLTYDRLNERPRTNNLGLLPDASALLQMSYADSLEENNTTYWYKVEGFDYFGSITTAKEIVSGQGYDMIRISPIIEYANQTEDNQAHLKWYMPEEMDELVYRYRITRSDDDAGPYNIVVDSLDKTIKEIKIPLEKTENHFRVEAVPYRGKPVGSVPIFVMGQDTVPPVVPEIIGAFIDSLGNIEVKWKANVEEDLWGYRIFKSNFNEQEYGLVSNTISKDTIFRDTVDINFNTEHVYYKIYATDTRDNKSAFTLPIKVEKPDIFPPGMASIGKVEQKHDSILIHWQASGSKDVVHHHIFRRAINVENSWTLAGIPDDTKIGAPFVDIGLEYGVAYAYTIIAYDEAGLESEPVYPRKITLRRPEEKFVPTMGVTHTFDESSREIVLSWEFEESSRIEHILVYRGSTKNKLGKYKMLKGDAVNLVDLAANEEFLYYKVKPIYRGQREEYYSDTVEVKISKSE